MFEIIFSNLTIEKNYVKRLRYPANLLNNIDNFG